MSNELTATETFLERLRAKTSVAHTNLEQLPVSVSIVNPNVTNKEYVHYLNLMHDVVKQAEEEIFPALTAFVPDVNERNKTSLLENDLKALGFYKTQLHKPFENTASMSPAFAMGVLYVIEGSSLGGRVILKNIHTSLGHTEEQGASYFAGYGNQTGSKWKSFLNALTAYEAQTNNEKEIIAGAEYAFTTIGRHFS
ncbi:biliverdin-producing heme oxygenase [Flavobacterium alkalisoli]|uniref:Biliverdin-producing heme oxygenase n=1 Tax=Flavobacterium alkalisoli TaxID=2602769 RepID=A0A5B9FXD3_9FLAO|nr:biliverdin-producing heme oxygenase [Flavobacterium alkalisoli]QEE50428.1 biliverdin-producing heme oxygenase [Flavobacterium alkalisoli]